MTDPQPDDIREWPPEARRDYDALFGDDPQPTTRDDQPRSRWTADGDDTLVLDAHSNNPLRFTYDHRSEITETEFEALVAVVRDHAAVTRERDALQAVEEAVRAWGPYTPRRVTRALADLDAARAALEDTP